jgi:hypothetical protein
MTLRAGSVLTTTCPLQRRVLKVARAARSGSRVRSARISARDARLAAEPSAVFARAVGSFATSQPPPSVGERAGDDRAEPRRPAPGGLPDRAGQPVDHEEVNAD